MCMPTGNDGTLRFERNTWGLVPALFFFFYHYCYLFCYFLNPQPFSSRTALTLFPEFFPSPVYSEPPRNDLNILSIPLLLTIAHSRRKGLYRTQLLMQSRVVSSAVMFLGGIAGAVKSLPAFVTSSFGAIVDPEDGRGSAAFAEITALTALHHMQRLMMADEMGRSILKERPQVTDETLEFAKTQPEGTFGYRYAAFMKRNNFLPSGRAPILHVSDPTLAYVMLRYRQIHDFVHAYVGLGRTIEEELAVKLFEWQHTGLPVGLMAVLGGMPWLRMDQILNMGMYNEWARANAPRQLHGKRFVSCILNVPWEWYLDKPYEQLVDDVGIVPLDAFLKERKSGGLHDS
nr:Coq4p [Trypanosoma brucei brucei]